MRHWLFLICFLLFSTTVFSQIEVEQKQRSLIMKRTADWCVNCGTWGWDYFKDLIDETSDNTSILAAHHSGFLQTNVSFELTNSLDGFGQPNFYFGKDLIAVGGTSWMSVKEEIKQAIDDLYDNGSPDAAIGLRLSIDSGNEMLLESKTVFYEDMNHDIYVSFYVVRNNIIAYQDGIGEDAVHQKVLRLELSHQPYGSLLVEGPIEAGQEIDYEVPFRLGDNFDLSNMELIAVLWEKDGDNYNYVNTNKTSNIEGLPTSTDQLLSKDAYSITPNISTDFVNIQMNPAQPVSDAMVDLLNINGQLIHQLYKGALSSTQHVELQRSALNLSAGTYIVRINLDGKATTEKVIFVD